MAAIYGDSLRSRNLAFLDAVLGPVRAVETMRRIEALSIGIVGCGGIGSSAAYLLAGLGARRFTVIDPDRVEAGNLTRQVLYTLADAGKPKAQCLSRALKARFVGMAIKTYETTALAPAVVTALRDVDVIVCAGDDPPDLAMHLRTALPRSVPIWACGYLLGVSIVRGPDKVKPLSGPPEKWVSLRHGFAPSVGFQNYEVAAACVADIVRFCHRGTAPRLIVKDYRDVI